MKVPHHVCVAALVLAPLFPGHAAEDFKLPVPNLPASHADMGVTTDASFYVAVNGNDAWPGTEARPFATLGKAEWR